jgi:hypothetical protein
MFGITSSCYSRRCLRWGKLLPGPESWPRVDVNKWPFTLNECNTTCFWERCLLATVYHLYPVLRLCTVLSPFLFNSSRWVKSESLGYRIETSVLFIDNFWNFLDVTQVEYVKRGSNGRVTSGYLQTPGIIFFSLAGDHTPYAQQRYLVLPPRRETINLFSSGGHVAGSGLGHPVPYQIAPPRTPEKRAWKNK